MSAIAFELPDDVIAVRDGVLRAEDGVGLPSGSNLQVLENGLFESTGASFTRALGTAAGEVQVLNGVAGFGASGTAVAVNLGGAGGTVTWGSASFAPTEFVLNGATSDGTIDFQNGLDLNGAMRTVRVDADPAAAVAVFDHRTIDQHPFPRPEFQNQPAHAASPLTLRRPRMMLVLISTRMAASAVPARILRDCISVNSAR